METSAKAMLGKPWNQCKAISCEDVDQKKTFMINQWHLWIRSRSMQENCICLGTFHRTSQKIPKTVQQPQQRPELPETKWEFTFLQLWNNKRKKAPQGKKYTMINNKSSGMKRSFKYEVYNINAAKTVAWRWAIWLKTILNFFPWTPFPVNDMITNFGFLGRMWTSGTVHCSKL